MLERMRIIDMVAYWAKGTHQSYQTKLRIVRDFERLHPGVNILQPTVLTHPPGGPDIPLMWCQEAYSLRPSTRRFDKDVSVPITYASVRQLRSAVSQFWAWDMLVSRPNRVFLTKDQRLLDQPCRPSDGFSYTLFAKGISTRLGTESTPSMALLDTHVRTFDHQLNDRYLQATTDVEKRELALAGLANLVLWLGWLRSSECFGLQWEDLSWLYPDDSQEKDLPANCGMVSLRLAAETKSDRSRRPDVLLAFQTMSGLNIGKWVLRSRLWRRPSDTYVFSHLDGTPWTSLFFRTAYLYPSLYKQQAEGDVYLRPFNDVRGNRIEDKFWSLHCYRRGARSHVSRGGNFGRFRFRKASNDQVYEHARWRKSRSSEAVDKQYMDWTPRDRILITFLCH